MDLAAADIAVTAVDQAAAASFAADARRDPDMEVSYGSIGLTATVTAEAEDQVLFLPLAATGWRCEVNGESVKLVYPLDVMVGVPLQKGENTVRLWRPARWIVPKKGLTISLETLAVCALWALLRRPRPWPF